MKRYLILGDIYVYVDFYGVISCVIKNLIGEFIFLWILIEVGIMVFCYSVVWDV